MRDFLISTAAAGFAFAVLDFVWLSLMVSRLYRPRLGDILRTPLALKPALAFYLIYSAGMALLAILPALAAHAPIQALTTGAILGLVAYATYDLSNWATLKRWSATVALVDIAWGVVVTGLSSWFGATIALMFIQA